jgi:predicted enzyme related to lactoylglutathione lyase
MPHLGVADIHALHRSLSDEGVEFIRPPEKEGWGGWVATFKDPDGNIVQLLQFPAAGE